MKPRTKPTKAEIRKWANALRSGKYSQGKGALQTSSGYCCLGVACKIFIPENQIEMMDGRIYGTMPNAQKFSPRWLNDIDQLFFEFYGIYPMKLNDDYKYSFNEIADLLEIQFLYN